jgi:hypothetical protein
LPAREQPLEIVTVSHVAVAISVPSVEDLLHLEEDLLRHDCFVPSDVELVLVADDSCVVRIAEHRSKAGLVDRALRSARRGAHRQALLLHVRCELRNGVLAGGVRLERERDEWSAFWISLDGVDEASAEVLANIQVADLGNSDRAALLHLVRHLHLDVFAVHSDLDFVHDVGDGFHSVRHVTLAELFLRGDESDALGE